MTCVPSPWPRVCAAALALALVAAGIMAAEPAVGVVPIGFGKSLFAGQSSVLPTSLQFGPDGRLYVGRFDGGIDVYDVARHGPGDYAVTATETIGAVQSIANHDDDGSPNPGLTTRLLTGLLVVGTADHPVIYASSSDPRRGVINGSDLGIDTNSGVISRLTWNGSAWIHEQLVRGLPRSRNVHATNGLALDEATGTLYVAQGGHTNMGAPSAAFQLLPEYELSAAILAIDLDGLGTLPYDLPTRDDPARAGAADANDPFGGSAGKNQAVIVTGGPVSVYSPGYRNPYDLILAENGRLYATDNGGNAGEGGPPVGEGPGTACTDDVSEPGAFGYDTVHLVTGPGYYGGHPDPSRDQCDFLTAGVDRPSLATFPTSTNGITEYTASNFGGAMMGDLLVAQWDDYVSRIDMNDAGTAAAGSQVLFANAGTHPLDITAQGDAGPFPGTVWMADQAASTITVFEPNDYEGASPTCRGATGTIDEDGDGFTNADEIANGTDPCSAGDIPPDADGDGISDRADGDDDDDGVPDLTDPFAVDPNDGNQTVIPVRYTWDPGAPSPGGILDSGFTGLMINRTTNYAAMYDATQLAVGGAPGLFSIEQVPANTAQGARNDQRYGFQFGVNARPQFSGRFVVHTAIVAPFAGMTPQNDQQMGMFVGSGDQDNYVKLVVAANGGGGGLKFLKEVAGTLSAQRARSVPMPGPSRVDLYLTVDPAAATIQPSYTVTTNGVTSPRRTMGTPVAVPKIWFSGRSTRTAVGLSSTSKGPGPPFPAVWDLIEVLPA
jgi:hypothetical protein